MVTRWTWADIIRSNHHLDKCLYWKTYLLTFPTISPCRSWWTRILTTLPTFRRSALSKLRLTLTSNAGPASTILTTFYILSGCQPSLHYQLSILWNLQQVKVTPGDSLMTTCTYDTTERTNVTLGGFGFTEEMWELRVLMWRTSLRIASNHLLSIQWCLLLILSVFVTRCKDLRTRMWPFLWRLPHPRCVNYVHYYPRADLELCKSSVAEKELDSYFHDLRAEEGQELHLEANVSQLYQEVPFIQSSFIVSVLIIYLPTGAVDSKKKQRAWRVLSSGTGWISATTSDIRIFHICINNISLCSIHTISIDVKIRTNHRCNAWSPIFHQHQEFPRKAGTTLPLWCWCALFWGWETK